MQLLQLQSLGYKRGDVVALFMTNSAEFPIVWLGLARLGVVTAWVNFNQRNNVLGHSVNISKANSIIISPELQEGTAKSPLSIGQRLITAVAEAMAGGHVDDSMRAFVFGSKSSTDTEVHSGIRNCTNIRPLVDAASDAVVKSETTFKGVASIHRSMRESFTCRYSLLHLHERHHWPAKGGRHQALQVLI